MVPIGINTTAVLCWILYPFDGSSRCQEFVARGLREMLPVGSRRRRLLTHPGFVRLETSSTGIIVSTEGYA